MNPPDRSIFDKMSLAIGSLGARARCAFRSSRKAAYLHVPKTGGTYLSEQSGARPPVLHPVKLLGHAYAVDGPGEQNPLYLQHAPRLAEQMVIPANRLKRHFVFATVRNLFDWLVSYAGHAGGWNKDYLDTAHYDYANANRGFDYLVKTVANREAPWPCRKFIHCQIFSSGGNLTVDWLNNTDQLDGDLAEMSAVANITYHRGVKQRVGARKDYRNYYNDELVELVSQTWRRELDLFGFVFESAGAKQPVLRKRVTQTQKQRVKYCWRTDRLSLLDQRMEAA